MKNIISYFIFTLAGAMILAMSGMSILQIVGIALIVVGFVSIHAGNN